MFNILLGLFLKYDINKKIYNKRNKIINIKHICRRLKRVLLENTYSVHPPNWGFRAI